MEAHRPEPEESWQDRQFDEQHRQVLDLFAVVAGSNLKVMNQYSMSTQNETAYASLMMVRNPYWLNIKQTHF